MNTRPAQSSQVTATILIVALTLPPAAARASIFGEENIVLGNILAANLKETVQMAEAIVVMREALEVGRETARLANDAVQVVENVKMIVEDPVGYLEANARVFAKSFPEINSMVRDARQIKTQLAGIGFDGRYDAMITLEALEQLSELESAFHIMTEMLDDYNLTDVHNDIMVKAIENQTRAASVQADMATEINHGDLSPQEATVFAAKAAAISAEADTQTLLIMNDIAKLEKARFAAEFDSAARDHNSWLREIEQMSRKRTPREFELPLAPF